MAKIAKLNKPLVNRIVGHGEEQVDQLLANPLNFRLHPDQQQQALAGAMDDIGFIRSVTVNKRTGRVVDGHLRVTIAARSNVESLPVEYVDLDEAEEAQALLSLDPIAALAATDKAKLDELMRSVQSDDERVQQMMAELAEREGLEYGKAEKQDDPGAQVDKAEELREKWGVETGQLWQLGDHRLICGDCTDRAVVDRVMQGEKAALAFADPPYNAGVDEWDKGFVWSQDWLIDIAPIVVVTPGISAVADFMKITQMPYVWSLGAWISNGFARGAVGFGNWMYAAVFATEKVYRQAQDFKKIDLVVGEADIPVRHRGQKPPRFMDWVIELFTEDSDVVIDPFHGSGTTTASCERLGRICRAIELDPAYVAVALQRWADMTGQTPTLLDVS